MNRNHTPGALNTELLKESRGDNALAGNKGVRIQESAANDTHDNNTESSTEDLTAETDNSTTEHCAEVGDDLSDGDRIGTEIELVLQHRRVQVLGSVGHEVETGHQKHEVCEKQPVAAESNLAFEKEGLGNALALRLGGSSNAGMLLVNGCLREHETEENDKDGRAGTEPEEWAPAMGCGVDEASSKGRRQKVTKSVLNLLVFGIEN